LTDQGRRGPAWSSWGLSILLQLAQVLACHRRIALAERLFRLQPEQLGDAGQSLWRALELGEKAEVESVQRHRDTVELPAGPVLVEGELDRVAERFEEVAGRGGVGDLDLGLLADLDVVLETGRPLGRDDAVMAPIEDPQAEADLALGGHRE